MSQCVPNWDLGDSPAPARLSGRSLLNSTPPDVPVLDYEVAELTWENGQLAMHGLGQPRVSLKPLPGQPQPPAGNRYASWDKLPQGAGTLESIVDLAAATTGLPAQAQRKHQPPPPLQTFDDLVPWFDRPGGGAASATMTMDALVPCAATASNPDHQNLQEQAMAMPPACVVGSSSGAAALQEEGRRKRSRVVGGSVRVPTGEWSQYSVSGSATTAGRERADSQQMTLDTCERDGYTSIGSQDNTSSGTLPCTRATATTTATADDYDSVCHSRSQREVGGEDVKVKRNGKSSISTKRSRAAAIHNQSERKRRDKINQRMKTLQKLVPSSSKTDKASVLDEVIEYLKQLQAQIQMMSRMNMPQMMLPMAMQQQQLQMSMMASMGLGMGMGMGMAGVMDLNVLASPKLPGMPPMLHPAAAAAAAPFMPLAAPWDGSAGNGDRIHPASTATTAGAAVLGDPLSAFLACQSQPMALDTYIRMAAIYQQLHQPPASSSKN